jgi:hypothetical protein
MTTLCLSKKENEKCGLKKYVKIVSKLKLKNKASSNEEFISEVMYILNFPNVSIFNFLKF